MLKKVLLTAIVLSSAFLGYSQLDSSLTISGSLDAYYRYNFSNSKTDGYNSNSYTSFTSSQNSFELGMASIKAAYATGKVDAVLDLGFGKRAQEFSYVDVTDGDDGGPTALAFVKQAFISYSPIEKLKFTAGKFGTHIGYELLDPQLNRNYSMSYLFSYGPFSHTGLKADVSLSDHFGAMVGITNPTDYVTANFAKKFAIAQVSGTFDGFSAYLNYVGGKDFGNNGINQFGLTALATITDKFSIGYDGSVKSVKPQSGSAESWWGSALYLNVDPSPMFGITLRGEYFDDKKGVAGFGTSIFQGTLSFNIKPTSNFIILPEFRLDSATDPIFSKGASGTTKSTGTFNLAGIFYF